MMNSFQIAIGKELTSSSKVIQYKFSMSQCHSMPLFVACLCLVLNKGFTKNNMDLSLSLIAGRSKVGEGSSELFSVELLFLLFLTACCYQIGLECPPLKRKKSKNITQHIQQVCSPSHLGLQHISNLV